MDIKSIQKLIDLVKKNNVAELEISQNGETIHIVLNQLENVSKESGKVSLEGKKVDSVEPELQTLKVVNNRKAIKSPMVGTVYLGASPDATHFVQKGQRIKMGDTLCIIEAMKMFNRIEAEQEGVVVDILVKDSSPVEYGQALFIIE